MPVLNISLPDDLHRRAKGAASLTGVTLKDYVTRAVLEATERDLRAALDESTAARAPKGTKR